MTNREIYELYGCLFRNRQLKFSKTAYAAYRNYGVIRNQGETIDKLKQALLDEYGEPADNGNYRFKSMDQFKEYQAKEKELMDMDVDDIAIHRIPRETFDKEVERLITEDGVTMGDCDILERYLVEG